MSAEPESHVRYRFGPLERRGLIAGWRGGQIAAVAGGLVVGMVAIRSDASFGGAVMALLAVGMGVAAATWPLKGRTLEEWAPDAIRYAARPTRRPKRGDPFAYLSVVPVDVAREKASHRPQPGQEAAVIVDRAARTYAAAFFARSAGFVLLSESDKCQRVATWAAVLSSLARESSPVHRVQWICRTTTSTQAHAGANGKVSIDGDGALSGPASARRSYRALLDGTDASFSRYQVLISVKVKSAKSAKGARSVGGKGTHEGAGCAAVLRETGALRRRLMTAGIEADPPLSCIALADFVRSSLDTCRPHDDRRIPGAGNPPGVDAASVRSYGSLPKRSGPGWPWLMSTQEEWGRVLVDGTWHRTYWISEWPRLEVGPDFLGPLLLLRDVRHSVSVVMEPMSPTNAARKLEQARTADVADAELRRRGGFLATARRRREEQLLEQREVELADGHAPFRFSGYVTVSAEEPDLLDEQADAVEQAAARCGVELRICYGDQMSALLTALPLCRGLA